MTTLRTVTELRTPPVSDGDMFSARVRQYAAGGHQQPIRILEAGCGWGGGLDLGELDRHVTGVDADTPELLAHTRTRPDLDGWHLGDLRTVPMPPRAYDIVHAPYLIERVQCAELVLDRFVAALKPGGLLLLKLRDRDTAYGWLDRVLPGWMHPLAAGDAPAAGPPPACYDRVASRRGIQWYCTMRGLVITEEYASLVPGAQSGVLGRLCRLVAAASRGRLTAGHCALTLVIRKPQNRFARVL